MQVPKVTIVVVVLAIACSLTPAVAESRSNTTVLDLNCDYWLARWANTPFDAPLTFVCMVADGGSPVPSSDKDNALQSAGTSSGPTRLLTAEDHLGKSCGNPSEAEPSDRTVRRGWPARFLLSI